MNEASSPGGALLTDLYQLTMAYGYWRSGRGERQAVFELLFRKAPFNSGFTLAAGLEPAIEFIRSFRFNEDDLAFLRTLTGNNGQPLFDTEFLEYLRALQLTCHVDAIPEGTVVFPNEPLLRIQGAILQCQLLETALLNFINFQSLIATKAARVCLAARGEPVLEFGLRRAQGIDGALAASRAAHIGGCAATSNVLAGKMYGIPVRGTHAHSWVMSFDSESEAFAAYAEAMPNNCVFLVDAYDTLEGVRRAVRAGLRLRERGHEMVGIRLDSGDLAWLSLEARKILDAAGFQNAIIVGSNDLDEHIIASLKEQGATINHGSFAANHPGRKPFEQVELNGLPQTLWPVHCVQNTKGAELAPSLRHEHIAKIFPKGTDPAIDSYSGFFDNGHCKATGLAEWLREQGVNEVYVCGLAADYCVKFTALDAAGLGFKTHLIEDASRGVNLQAGDVANAIAEMKHAGIAVVQSTDILNYIAHE